MIPKPKGFAIAVFPQGVQKTAQRARVPPLELKPAPIRPSTGGEDPDLSSAMSLIIRWVSSYSFLALP